MEGPTGTCPSVVCAWCLDRVRRSARWACHQAPLVVGACLKMRLDASCAHNQAPLPCCDLAAAPPTLQLSGAERRGHHAGASPSQCLAPRPREAPSSAAGGCRWSRSKRRGHRWSRGRIARGGHLLRSATRARCSPARTASPTRSGTCLPSRREDASSRSRTTSRCRGDSADPSSGEHGRACCTARPRGRASARSLTTARSAGSRRPPSAWAPQGPSTPLGSNVLRPRLGQPECPWSFLPPPVRQPLRSLRRDPIELGGVLTDDRASQGVPQQGAHRQAEGSVTGRHPQGILTGDPADHR